jgi:hypothetical protein
MPQDGSLALVIRAPGVASNTALGKFRKDALARRTDFTPTFIFDLPSKGGWPKSAAPASGDAVPDFSALSGNGAIAGNSATYAGGGFDLSACNTASSGAIRTPAAAMAAIKTAFATAQSFGMLMWIKVPVVGDFPASTTPTYLTNGGDHATAAALGSFGMYAPGGTKCFMFDRQKGAAPGTSTAEVDRSFIAVNASTYGQLALVFMGYNATTGVQRIGYRCAAVGGGIVQSQTLTNGGTSSQDFSAVQHEFGVGTRWSGTAQQLAANNMRIYRGAIGYGTAAMDILTVQDAEWTAVQARITADIAANGSQTIFV